MPSQQVTILAVSDEVVPFIYSTQLKQRFRQVDFVIACGDLPFYYLEFIATVLAVPVYYVHGNHDQKNQVFADGHTSTEPEGCLSLEGQITSEQGLMMTGLGGSIRYRPDGHNQYTQSEMYWRSWRLWPRLWWKRYRSGRSLDVLVAHSPPFGIHDLPDPAHIGFHAFLTLMRLFQPKLFLHGHCHVYRNDTITRTVFSQTQVVNVYPYRLLHYQPSTGFVV